MKFEDEIKILTREPNLVIARFGLDSSPRTIPEILDSIRVVMGYQSKRKLADDHPYFNTKSLQSNL